jgi:hypothetical protein
LEQPSLGEKLEVGLERPHLIDFNRDLINKSAALPQGIVSDAEAAYLASKSYREFLSYVEISKSQAIVERSRNLR